MKSIFSAYLFRGAKASPLGGFINKGGNPGRVGRYFPCCENFG